LEIARKADGTANYDTMDDMNTAPGSRSSFPRWLRLAAVAVIYAALLLLGYWGSGWLTDGLGLTPSDGSLIVNDGKVWFGILIYTLLLALPFVPGIEISVGMLATFGAAIAIQVYLATVAAFVLAYVIGRMVPSRLLSEFFRLIGLTSAEELMKRLAPLSRKERLAMLVDHAPRRFIPHLVRYRYIALVLAFNLPGNAVVGGGGGIALLAGLSGMFSFPHYLFATSIAALPVPLAALLVGRII
jgi:hypothetical protein